MTTEFPVLPHLPQALPLIGGPFDGQSCMVEDCPSTATFTYRTWTGRYVWAAAKRALVWEEPPDGHDASGWPLGG